MPLPASILNLFPDEVGEKTYTFDMYLLVTRNSTEGYSWQLRMLPPENEKSQVLYSSCPPQQTREDADVRWFQSVVLS